MLAENSNGNMVMPVGPMGGYGGFGSGTGFGDGLFWIIVLFLFAFMGNGFGFGGGFGNGGVTVQNDVQRGFDQQSVMTGINGINAGINGLAQAQCNGFAGVNAALNSGFSAAEIAANTRQMANMQQDFNAQSALTTQLNGMAMTQQQCCCENRAAVADVKYTMAQEAAATRANTDAKVQGVMDKLCQLEMDGMRQNYENRIAGMQNQIDALRGDLNAANSAARVNAQTAAIVANNEAQTAALENYLNPPARPAYIVQNPNCCAQNWNGCGCGSY